MKKRLDFIKDILEVVFTVLADSLMLIAVISLLVSLIRGFN